MNEPAQNRTINGLDPKTAMQLGVLMQRMAGNPKTRQRTLEMLKELDPNYRLPGDVQITALENKLKAERAAEKQAEQQERVKANRTRARAKLVEAHGEDYVKGIEEGPLKKYPHISYDDAAKLYAADTEPLRPNGNRPEPARHGQIWEYPVPEGASDAAFMANPEKVAADVAYSMIDGFRSGKRPV